MDGKEMVKVFKSESNAKGVAAVVAKQSTKKTIKALLSDELKSYEKELAGMVKPGYVTKNEDGTFSAVTSTRFLAFDNPWAVTAEEKKEREEIERQTGIARDMIAYVAWIKEMISCCG